MRKDTENPEGNGLPPGCKEQALVSAIEESGYPLQGQVAYELKEHFNVTEEWGFFDSSTNEHRSLDMVGYRRLSEDANAPVQPSCAVLVECKRSRHPYVFFRRVTDRLIPGFPAVAAVPGEIRIYEANSGRSMVVPGSRVLGLDDVPFVAPGPHSCATFSRAVPKGNGFELSGVDPFKNIILPLARALDHTLEMWKPDRLPSHTAPNVGLVDQRT